MTPFRVSMVAVSSRSFEIVRVFEGLPYPVDGVMFVDGSLAVPARMLDECRSVPVGVGLVAGRRPRARQHS
jgi:hypothetical protein